MQNKSDGYCYLCARRYGIYDRKENLQEHHVIFGRANRKLSEKYGLKVYLCLWHHTEGPEAVHHNARLRQQLEEDAQRAFLRTHTMTEWMAVFGRNFIIMSDSPPHLDFKPKNENLGITFFEENGE